MNSLKMSDVFELPMSVDGYIVKSQPLECVDLIAPYVSKVECGSGADAKAAAFIELTLEGKNEWGAGIDGNTVKVFDITDSFSSCFSGYYLDAVTGICKMCPTACLEYASLSNCSSCAPNFTLSNETCVAGTNTTSNSTTNTTEETSISIQKSTLEQVIDTLVNNDGIAIMNKVPGGRKMIPFFCFLINIDELWLYQYH